MKYSWSEGVPCIGRTDVMFGEADRAHKDGDSTAVAKAICGGCHAITECLAAAEALRRSGSAPAGTWGGKSQRQRQKQKQVVATVS
jgi:hypothetical protein